MKYVFWGLGQVGQSFLNKLIENGYFNPELFYLVDTSENAKDFFVSKGGLSSHIISEQINKNNWENHMKSLEKGDYLLEFGCNIKNTLVTEYCLQNDIHYLFTADASWKNDPEWISCHQHFQEYVLLKDKYKDAKGTVIIEFGMNPGLVSMFVKKCIKEIVEKDKSLYVRLNRKKLQKLIDEKKYGVVAKKLRIKDVQEVDNDTHETSIPFEEDVCYSTWNVYSYYYETVSSPELALGTKHRYFKYNKIYDCDEKDLYIAPFDPGFTYRDFSVSPQGEFKGHISTHEEIYSIRHYLSCGRYRPSVHFLYSPCDYAYRSVSKFVEVEPEKFHLITKEEITSGGESVGIILQGRRFKTRYFGNYLETANEKECATILQVSASAFSAFQYMIKHPDLGLCFPEDLDEEEMLEFASNYLHKYDTFVTKKIPMTLGVIKK